MRLHDVNLSDDSIADFCARHGIARLSLFGSILRPDFGADSDVDVLIEFAPDRTPGLFAFAGMELELTRLIGRRAHLHTPAMLGPDFRDTVIRGARVQYAA